MYLYVKGIGHVFVCQRYRSCICMLEVSIMYLYVRGIDLASISTIFLLNFEMFRQQCGVFCYPFYWFYFVYIFVYHNYCSTDQYSTKIDLSCNYNNIASTTGLSPMFIFIFLQGNIKVQKGIKLKTNLNLLKTRTQTTIIIQTEKAKQINAIAQNHEEIIYL